MNKATPLMLRMSRIRQQLNEFPDDGADADRDALTAEYSTVESQYRAALILDQDDLANGDPMTGGEGNEVRGLLGRVGVGDYLSAAMAGRTVDGAAAELRMALLGEDAPAEMMPIDLLLPELRGEPGTQMRADAATTVTTAIQENQSSIAGRVFNIGSLDYIGADRPTVPFGTATYVALATGTDADARSEGVAQDATAATFTTKSINPSRVAARYLFDNINDVRMRGTSDALATDLRGAIAQKLDTVGLNGQAAVANTSPALVGIIGGLTDPTDPGDTVAWDDVLDLYDLAVDGKFALDASSVRALVNPESWRFCRKLQVATSGQLLRDLLPDGRFRMSAAMPDTASGIATVLTYLSGPGRGFTQAVWRGVRLIRDVYTKSAEDQTAVTATIYLGQDMVDTARYARREIKLT